MDLLDPTDLAPADDAVVVRVAGGRYAIPLAHVAEVTRVPAVTRIPGVPGWVLGAANWRGRILPVLDVRALLGADVAAPGPAARVIVLTSEVATLGVVVDEIEGMAALGTAMTPLPSVLDARDGLVAGQVTRADGPIAVLDVPRIAALRHTLPRSRRSA